MKFLLNFLVVLTIFTIQNAQAKSRRYRVGLPVVYSQVCGQRYVEGIKVVTRDGQERFKCLHKGYLSAHYQTHDQAKCYRNYVPGRSFYGEKFDYKVCIHEDKLGESYKTALLNSCAEGYHTDGYNHFPKEDKPFKICIRD